MSALFTPFQMRELKFRNRIFVSPMCQYSSVDGFPAPWHLVHLGSRAVGGAALVMTEAAAVVPEGRISLQDLGIWSDAQADALQPIAAFIRKQGAVAAIQLAHAGRKASTVRPWDGTGEVAPGAGGWQTVAPSAVRFSPEYPMPRELTENEILQLPAAFAAAAERALRADFQVVEIHAAHGYLLHEFLSPLSNLRDDAYGGSFENRIRVVVSVARAVRETWPKEWPVFVRISASDWAPGGWDLPQSVRLARALKEADIDLVDCSSGGLVPTQQIAIGPSYQVPFADAIRREAEIATGAVGLITVPAQAEAIIAQGQADVVLLARAFLRDPYWTHHAAQALGFVDRTHWPAQYGRA
jgi:2,4-dienoyl-CoA reductase-like NADH-dependent reductase (Old Yellow Enzyme family)